MTLYTAEQRGYLVPQCRLGDIALAYDRERPWVVAEIVVDGRAKRLVIKAEFSGDTPASSSIFVNAILPRQVDEGASLYLPSVDGRTGMDGKPPMRGDAAFMSASCTNHVRHSSSLNQASDELPYWS